MLKEKYDGNINIKIKESLIAPTEATRCLLKTHEDVSLADTSRT